MATFFPLKIKKARRFDTRRLRSAIAVALANDPVVILGDEPTGNLDTKNAESIASLLVSLGADYGKTVFLATHDPRVAGRVHKTHTMVDGKLDWKGD